MGYFSNSSEGEAYKAMYCDRCVHGGGNCEVWGLHLDSNYEDCNNEDSMLHRLIPRSKDDMGNLQCRMFIEKGKK